MISLLLSVPALWLFASLALLLLLHVHTLRVLWREPVIAYPVLIVESDDWGVGPHGDAEMLSRIAARLADIRDTTGHPAVMTLGLVTGHPDGAAILASGLTHYYRRTLAEPEFAAIVEAIRAGCASSVFALQRHGLEHCWPQSLLARARNDEALQRWLADPAARSEGLPSSLQSRWVDTSSLPSKPLPEAQVRAAVAEEADLIRRIFGAAPSVAVPNTFVWSDAVERAWIATGVTCIVTPGRRLEGRSASGGLQAATCTIRNGERTSGGAIQVVRDDYFEPSRGHRADQVWQALVTKTLLGRPTLLETHRESFVAAPEIAESALDELERALRGALHCRADVRFLSTADLAQHLADSASPLLIRPFAERIGPVLQRVLHEASLRRLLKFSGLKVALVLVVRLISRVMDGRSQGVAR